METIVITGGTGFVGSNLVRFLVKRDFNVYLITRPNSSQINIEDCRDKLEIYEYNKDINGLISFFKSVRPTVVFHLASYFLAEHKPDQIDSLIESNISFGVHILEAMKISGVRSLINVGTSWQHYESNFYNPVCLYAATKQSFEDLIAFYVDSEDFKVYTLKLYDTYGETDKRQKLINLLYQYSRNETTISLSPGDQELYLVHIEDVCVAFLKAFETLKTESNKCHKLYSLPANELYTLKEVISIFEKVSGKSLLVQWGGKNYRKREVMKVWNDGDILPGWKANISLEEGFSKILNHISTI